ncbi:unnamed protein product [Hapterophycus canaliculatus]
MTCVGFRRSERCSSRYDRLAGTISSSGGSPLVNPRHPRQHRANRSLLGRRKARVTEAVLSNCCELGPARSTTTFSTGIRHRWRAVGRSASMRPPISPRALAACTDLSRNEGEARFVDGMGACPPTYSAKHKLMQKKASPERTAPRAGKFNAVCSAAATPSPTMRLV